MTKTQCLLRHLLLCALCALGQPALGTTAERVVLVLGDSLSAAYGMPVEYGWVALLDDALAAQHIPARVVNARISGETTGGGLARLPGLLQRYPADVVVIELGGNNGLRGQPLELLREELRQLIRLSQASGLPVTLSRRSPVGWCHS